MPSIERRARDVDAAEPELQPDVHEEVLGSEEARGMAVVQPDEMPSRFLPYPEGVRIFYRPYEYDEITTFSDSNIGIDERARFVSKGILVRGMDKDMLTLSDWLYLGLLRKVSSLGTGRFTVTVPADEELGRLAYTTELSMGDISVSDLDVPALPAVMSLRGREVHFSPLTIGGFMKLMHKIRAELQAKLIGMAEAAAEAAGKPLTDEERKEVMASADKREMRDPTDSELAAYSCINNDPEAILPDIRTAKTAELTDLQEIDAAFAHRTDPITVRWKQKDGKEFSETVWIDDPLALVWPFRGHEKPAGSTLRFGL